MNCIWCLESTPNVTFNKKAHTVPRSLGGLHICDSVCDDCNSYFGEYEEGNPPIETVLKETFNISRVRLLGSDEIGKNKVLARPSSIYFKIDYPNRKLGLKGKYSLKPGFQKTIGRQMKRGIYKMFLEETQRQFGSAFEPRFNFIRDFARYDQGDCPIVYFVRSVGVVLSLKEWNRHPELLLKENRQMTYLITEPHFSEFEFLGHTMAIATNENWNNSIDSFIQKSLALKSQFFKGGLLVENFNDFDLSLSYLDS